MIDIQFIRDNPELVAQKAAQKGYPVDIPHLLELDKRWRQLLGEVERLRMRRNELAGAAQGQRPTDVQIQAGKELKSRLSELEQQLATAEAEYHGLLQAVPNMPLEYVPVGATEDKNVVVKTVGTPKAFDFPPRHDYQLGALHDLIDKERAAKIAGSRFAYLKGGLVRLQFALIQFTFNKLADEQFIQRLVQENNLQL